MGDDHVYLCQHFTAGLLVQVVTNNRLSKHIVHTDVPLVPLEHGSKN